ncbi:hypothetical protein FIA58_013910 [Flavobacterium jejuense]|uniref:Uncharacterized protein n=1 Tax=Flavobacterium jejuense TaxID=1544455 RepID=A0ABX0IUA4_9FLAO|nr:hypothetical protein [Flavobacterium jejuense]NHN26776.1 hypothetical protein [Flavobacterium jejuense]
MDTIEVTFPLEIDPNQVIYILESSLSKFTKYNCKVDFKGIEENENIFFISSKDGANAFYFIGMAASNIMHLLDKNKKS